MGFIIPAIVFLIAIYAWRVYIKSPSTGRLIVAIIPTVFLLPTIIAIVFKVTFVAIIFVLISLVVLALFKGKTK